MTEVHMSEHARNESLDRWERRYTAVDLLAGLCFFVGSLLFFSEATKVAATTLFVIGSALFVVRPALRLLRANHLVPAQIPVDGTESES
jgi:uncharacterized membrane protein YgdD (TMEM256/DUF423 family)